MASTRSMGWLREETGQHDETCGISRSIESYLGTPAPLPDEALEMRAALPSFRDQDGTESCVAHGILNAAETSLLSRGVSIAPGSARALYTLTRMLTRSSADDPLLDEGSYGRVAMQACKEFGVPPETDFPLWQNGSSLSSQINDEVPPDIIQRGSSWKLDEQFVIRETGSARIDAVCAALAAYHPLPVAGRVDDAFLNYAGTGVLPAPDPNRDRGGHMVCLVGYRTSSARFRQFLTLNSWPNWGLPGSLAWVSEEWVRALQEIYAFTLTHGRLTA